MLTNELLRAKREGRRLTQEEIRFLVEGITDETLSGAQTGAFAMCACIMGLDLEERGHLTAAMRDSGEVLSWREHTDRPVLDKHSTGGIGDKVSLVLAPLVAACGGAVPMISGRGLGHTGGTLDKLDAIPGYVSQPDVDRFRAVVADVGCAIVGQTAALAPADKRLYAVRDATGSVESVGLITASILSKKLAAGLDALVLDVKHGGGAFMESTDEARELARSLVDVAARNGLKATALLTDMDQVLGRTAGNAVEVLESVQALRGDGDPRLLEVTLALTQELLQLGGIDADPQEALDSGAAAEVFGRMVHALGGPADFVERAEAHLPAADVVAPVLPERPGVVLEHATRDLGVAVMALGGGRRVESDPVDHAVGLTEIAAPGEQVGPDRPLAVVHARDQAGWDAAAAAVRAGILVGDAAVEAPGAITERIA